MTRNAERHPVRRLAAITLVLVVAITTALGLRSCGDEPTLTDGAGAPPAGADASPERARRHVARPGPAAGESDARGRETVSAQDAGTPRTTEELSPPWQRLDAPRREVEGRVVGTDGAPRAGVEVNLASTWLDEAARRALQDADQLSRHLVVTTTSARDGTFRLQYVDGGARRIVAGWLAQPLAVATVEDGRPVELVVPDEHRTLHVTVVDPQGRPLPDTIVWTEVALPWDQSSLSGTLVLHPSGTTGEDGAVDVAGVPAGRLTVYAIHTKTQDMPQRTIVDVPAGGQAAVVIRLRPETAVVGHVLDAETRAPIRDAHASDARRQSRSSPSQGDGTFRLPLPLEPDVPQAVVVLAAGYAPQIVIALIREPPRDGLDCPVEVALHRTAAATLRCTDEQGRAIAGATVVLRSPYVAAHVPLRAVHAVVRAASTDDEGRVRVDGLHPGGELPARLEIRRAGVLQRQQEIPRLRAGEERELGTFVLTR